MEEVPDIGERVLVDPLNLMAAAQESVDGFSRVLRGLGFVRELMERVHAGRWRHLRFRPRGLRSCVRWNSVALETG